MSHNHSYKYVRSRSSSFSSHGSSCAGGCSRSAGFRLSPRKFSVQRLRARVIRLFRSSYGQALRLVRNGFFFCRRRNGCSRRPACTFRRSSSNSSRRNLVVVHGGNYHKSEEYCSGRAAGFETTGPCFRSNYSFYSEAIADCLEFIKRTSVSLDEDRGRDHHQ